MICYADIGSTIREDEVSNQLLNCNNSVVQVLSGTTSLLLSQEGCSIKDGTGVIIGTKVIPDATRIGSGEGPGSRQLGRGIEASRILTQGV